MQEKNPVGRPDKFTPEVRAAILESIARRIPYEYAAEANGISEKTLYRWLERGLVDINEGNDTEYAKFRQALKSVELNKMGNHLEEVAQKPERWQADAWILERRWHRQFGNNAAIKELAEELAEIKKLLNKDKDNGG